ncbi:MAG: serine/threonine-protein kinase [Kofleriaceae bacterium]
MIADTYTIEGLIGRGGMGAVFVASHARLPGKKVAIKVLHPDVADAESLARFRREAEIASRLGHPNIVEVHDWNQLPDGTPYLVLELLTGESLADRLRRGPMAIAEAAPLVRQVGAALAAAHREGIVHRDLKPANIFLVPQEDGPPKAKVLDFGISKIRGSATVNTQDTQMLGTPQYMAPEQATGRHAEVDGRTDVFALGAVLFEMLTGQGAFAGATIPEVVFKVVFEDAPKLATLAPTVPTAVAAAVDRALAKKADERWPDIASFVEAVTGAPLTARAPVPTAVRPTAGPATLPNPTPAKQSTQEAFAATVGSGDYGSALVSQARAVQDAAATAAPTVATPPRRRLGLMIGVVVLAAGAAAGGVVLARGGRGGGGQPQVSGVDAGPLDAPPALDAPGADAAAPIDAAPVDAAPPIDARPPARVDAGVSVAPPPDPPDDPGVRAAVVAATAALKAGDPDRADKLARAALNQHPGAQALLAVRAEAACHNSDLGTANTMMNGISRKALRAKVKRACQAVGVDL